MNNTDRYKLRFGPYRMPKCKVGGFLKCVVRGEKKVLAISDAPIPWPMTQHDSRKGCGRPYLVVCGDLVKAVRREAAQAVAHWWGVTPQTVWQWRKALGVERMTEGSRDLARDLFPEKMTAEVVERRAASLKCPQRAEKIAASKRGKPRPPHVGEAVRRAQTGRTPTAEARARMSEAAKRRGAWPPNAGAEWAAAEDEAARTLTPSGAAQKTGRTLTAVYRRRKRLGITGGRGTPWSPELDELLKSRTIEEATEATGRSRGGVMQRMWQLGISTAEVRRLWTADDDATLRRLGVHAAARVLERSLSATRSRWQLLGLSRKRS